MRVAATCTAPRGGRCARLRGMSARGRANALDSRRSSSLFWGPYCCRRELACKNHFRELAAVGRRASLNAHTTQDAMQSMLSSARSLAAGLSVAAGLPPLMCSPHLQYLS